MDDNEHSPAARPESSSNASSTAVMVEQPERHVNEQADNHETARPADLSTDLPGDDGVVPPNHSPTSFQSLEIAVSPAQATTWDGVVDVEVIFLKLIDADSKTSEQVRSTVRFLLDNSLSGKSSLSNVIYPSRISVQILGSDGVPRVVINSDVDQSSSGGIKISLDQADVKKVTSRTSLPDSRPTRVAKACQFIEITLSKKQKSFDFKNGRLLTAPLQLGKTSTEWLKHGFDKFFEGSAGPKTAAKTFTTPLARSLRTLPWTHTRLAIDGSFTLRFSTSKSHPIDAWAWLLTDEQPFGMLGVIHPENNDEVDSEIRIIILPEPPRWEKRDQGTGDTATASEDDACACKVPEGRIPTVVSESELANNPGVYTEDPGSFCTPFQNPERVLSEKSLYSVVRVEQPELSATASGNLRGPLLDFQRDLFVTHGVEVPSAHPTSFVAAPMFRSPAWSSIVGSIDSGRHEMSSQYPLQWEGDSLRYQATTVAKGHVLEFRMRTRSNGYSLGGVAKTLTLAPRQTKRIQKIEWSRSERASRVEGSRLSDSTNDTMTHDSSYQDAVSATLNEWSQGSSSSSVTAAAAGGGMALGPVVIGGGVAHSSANTSSQQSGGRNTSAAEESQWRDAVRRHGDALRKFESTVVQEVMQTESVTGTTEVIRNINYAHSLTVIYHNILRHLQVNTEFAGVRECLFVPFAIRPFTPDRALRWKSSISKALRDRSFSRALTYLKDVLTNFSNSTIPPGKRSEHPIRSLWGSLYLDLGIARPTDTADGKYDPTKWASLLPFLGDPALSIFQQLASLQTQIQDQTFQRRYAPTIAAKWCDKLQILVGTQALTADFTMASSYSYNGTVRVDFQVVPDDSVNREALSSLKVLAQQPLPPGSTARIKSLNYSYETDFEKDSVRLNRGVNDLIDAETGAVDSLGAVFDSVPSAYERRDLRQELRVATTDLINHLNEYVEYYHKAIWWNMDRDRLFMLLDGFTVPKLKDPVSIANVVERDPIAVAGNCLVFRVSAGAFLGNSELSIETPDQLFDYYNSNRPVSSPMYISLPTDGLYAQTIMDQCNALEEHYGNEDWALNDPDPDLGALDASLLASRKTDTPDMKPTPFPATIINLSNATPGPAPQGTAGVLSAVQNANAFRDMAGLAGTQQLATAGLQTAASLATSFGGSAAALEMAKIAGKQQAVADTDKKLASIRRAKDNNLMTDEQAAEHTNKVLNDITSDDVIKAPHEEGNLQQMLERFAEDESGQGKTFEASNSGGMVRVAFGDAFSTGDSIAPIAATLLFIRPSWTEFKNAYWTWDKYRDSKWVIRQTNAGWLKNPSYSNTCTLRLSQAFWDTERSIPANTKKVTGAETELSPQTGRRYLVKVGAGRKFLQYYWGDADVIVEKARGSAFDPATDNRFKGHKGVVVFDMTGGRDGTNRYNGHIDLWDGTAFSQESGWDGKGTVVRSEDWEEAKGIMLWYLTDADTSI